MIGKYQQHRVYYQEKFYCMLIAVPFSPSITVDPTVDLTFDPHNMSTVVRVIAAMPVTVSSRIQ